MIKITNKERCCGCEACVQACPKRCITFEEDAEGFRYPAVDTDLCIGCGFCETVCPILNIDTPSEPIRVCAAKNRNDEVRKSSSSGGVFSTLAETVIRQNGVVFGAMFSGSWEVIHGYTETTEGIADFRTSKYVQSRIGNCFREARCFLQQGRKVLFSGTPCQIAGLKHFLHKEYDNLLTIDVICHGVPSPKVWRMYLDDIRRNVSIDGNLVSTHPTHMFSEGDTQSRRTRINNISFRDKRLGWKKYSFTLDIADVSVDNKQNIVSFSQIHQQNLYMKGFLDNLYLRPSCYRCRFKKFRCKSDVSLADFWAISRVFPDFYDQSGVSLVFINTEKGKSLIDECAFEYRNTTFVSASSNHGLREIVQSHKKREYFFSKLDTTNSVSALIQECLKPTFFDRLLAKTKK